MFKKKIEKIKTTLDKFDTIERRIEYLWDHSPLIETKANDTFNKVVSIESRLDKLDEIDKLVNKINELVTENTKLKEENAIYLKYYDINSEATDEIKKEVFKEFEMRRLQKVNEALETQLQYAKNVSMAAGTIALSNYSNQYRPWWGY